MEFQRCSALQNVPERKLTDGKKKILSECEEDRDKKFDAGVCQKCRIRQQALDRFANSNIPVEYWNLNMDVEFQGFPGLLKKYNELIADITVTYDNGTSICLLGSHGLGKTFCVTSLLKHAVLKGYTTLYVTLSDIVNLIVSGETSDKFNGRRELMQVDFLVIDELDNRHFGSDLAADLYGRILEDVFRARLQNKLPTFMCTNSQKIEDAFPDKLKKSLGSLLKKVEKFVVLGSDFRGKQNGK